MFQAHLCDCFPLRRLRDEHRACSNFIVTKGVLRSLYIAIAIMRIYVSAHVWHGHTRTHMSGIFGQYKRTLHTHRCTCVHPIHTYVHFTCIDTYAFVHACACICIFFQTVAFVAVEIIHLKHVLDTVCSCRSVLFVFCWKPTTKRYVQQCTHSWPGLWLSQPDMNNEAAGSDIHPACLGV